jgi:hypothetical protein
MKMEISLMRKKTARTLNMVLKKLNEWTMAVPMSIQIHAGGERLAVSGAVSKENEIAVNTTNQDNKEAGLLKAGF